MEFDDETFEIERDGEKVECRVLFTFDCNDNLKSYVGYTDGSTTADGRKNIYISSYSMLNDKLELEDVTDERELEMISDVLDKIDKGEIE